MEWAVGTAEKPHGITWLEIFYIWEARGYNWEQTRQGQEKKLEESERRQEPATIRWRKHLQRKGKILKKRPEDEIEERSLGKELEEFKKW